MQNSNPMSGVQPTYHDIEERAYFIYLAEGCPANRCAAHWAMAEAQLRDELLREAAHSEPRPGDATPPRGGRRRK